MHKKRVITALLTAPFLFLIVWHGSEKLFKSLVAVVGALCLTEYYLMSFKFGVARYLGIVIGFFPILFTLIFDDPEKGLFIGLTTGLVASAIFFLLTYHFWENAQASWGKMILGISYVGFCIAHIPLIYFLPFGKKWVIFLIAVIFAGDIGAYYTGHAFGRTKLSPMISKGKTVEGAIGGLICNVLVALVLWFILFKKLDPWFIILLALGIGIVGQIGDLAESLVKRSAGVKDSGNLLPGHGGIFDRIDALIFASPILYWALVLFDSWKIILL